MTHLLVLVLNKPEYQSEILRVFRQVGVKGATIIDSVGMGRAKSEHQLTPLVAGLMRVLDNGHHYNKTILSVIEDEAVMRQAIEEVDRIIDFANLAPASCSPYRWTWCGACTIRLQRPTIELSRGPDQSPSTKRASGMARSSSLCEWYAREESNLRSQIRSLVLYPLSYGRVHLSIIQRIRHPGKRHANRLTSCLKMRPRSSKSRNMSKLAQAGDSSTQSPERANW